MNIQDTIIKPLSFYDQLVNPVFIGQTKADSKGTYYMTFEDEGVIYSFKCQI